MGYYMGDFYRGDFYRGDPGFWGGLGRLAKGAVGFIPGVGPIAQKVIGMIPGGARREVALGSVGAIEKAGAVLTRAKSGVLKHPVLSAAGAAGVVGAVGAGYHLARAGRMAGQPVRNRRMRVTNPKALRRAIRRAQGFAKLAQRVLRFTSPKHHRGRPYFKRVGKRRAA